MNYIPLIFLSFFSFFANAAEILSTVPKVDLDRYIGTWHEIARFANKHQKDCVKTQAEYSYGDKPGNIIIKNKCSLSDGSEKQISGIAHVDDPTNAKLKINFVPSWLRWLGIGWGNYWIIELDDDYQYAVVSEPKKEYLWILSRTPSMNKIIYAGLVSRLKDKGFDTANLIVSDQLNLPMTKVRGF